MKPGWILPLLGRKRLKKQELPEEAPLRSGWVICIYIHIYTQIFPLHYGTNTSLPRYCQRSRNSREISLQGPSTDGEVLPARCEGKPSLGMKISVQEPPTHLSPRAVKPTVTPRKKLAATLKNFREF